MSSQLSTFTIIREDQAVDPVTVTTDGLKIGRLPDCEIVLNHPTVSRLHAGIKEIGGRFYIFNFSHSSGTTLNNRLLPSEEAEALADGDVLQIGPFFLYIDRSGKTLSIKVSLQVAVYVGEAEARGEAPPAQPEAQAAPSAAAAAESQDVTDALNVFWKSRQREAGKMQRRSPLRPRPQASVLGKTRFNWTPTRDLVRPWPFAIFTWGLLVVGILSVLAAVLYTSAFSPAPISDPHTQATLDDTGRAMAIRANANSCTNCHSLRASMDDNCTSCHQSQAFVATVTPPHREAQVGCTDCHNEHRGEDFRPREASLKTCAECHNEQRIFNGERMHTPHRGTGFGYPVANGQWIWEGLDDEEWASKPIKVREQIKNWPLPPGDANKQRNAQFHALHVYRVRSVGGLKANKEGEISCSSCHTLSSNPANIDRVTPRTTCAECHNGKVDEATQRVLINDDTPNCTSCHVQHVKDKRHWNPSLLTANVVRPAAEDRDRSLTVSSH